MASVVKQAYASYPFHMKLREMWLGLQARLCMWKILSLFLIHSRRSTVLLQKFCNLKYDRIDSLLAFTFMMAGG